MRDMYNKCVWRWGGGCGGEGEGDEGEEGEKCTLQRHSDHQ